MTTQKVQIKRIKKERGQTGFDANIIAEIIYGR